MYESFALNGSVGAELAGGELRATGTWYREDYGSEWSGDGSQGIGNFATVVTVAPHPQNDSAVPRSTTLAKSHGQPDLPRCKHLRCRRYYQDQRYRPRPNTWTPNS